MSDAVSPDRHSFKDSIQKAQHGIDDLDAKRDSRVDIEGMDDAAREQLKQAYIDKVNVAQASIQRSIDQIDAMKRARSDGWREWESTVIDAEFDLMRALSTEHEYLRGRTEQPSVVIERVVAFNAKVDAFLAKLEAARAVQEQKKAERFTPRAAIDVMRALSPRLEQAEIERRAAAAVEKYGEAKLRDVSVALTLLNSLTPDMQKELFGDLPPAIDAQISAQLANGTFEKSPLAFLLEGSSAIERKVSLLREEKKDAVAATQLELQTLEKRTHARLVQLCQMAKEDVSKSTVESIVQWVMNTKGFPELQAQTVKAVREMATEANSLKERMQSEQQRVLLLDVALRNTDTARAREQGDAALETQLRFASKTDFGIDFTPTAKQLALLRPAQRATMEGKPDDAVRLAIDDFNLFNEQHADVDDLDRIDLLGIRDMRTRKVGAMQTEDRTIPRSPFELLGVRDERTSPLDGTDRRFERIFGAQPQRERVITDVGTVNAGGLNGSLVVLEWPGTRSKDMHTTIGFRDAEGVVRMQGGKIVDRPRILEPLQLDVRGVTGKESVYTTPETQALLARVLGGDSRSRVVLQRNEGVRLVNPSTSLRIDPIRTLDLSQLQVVTVDENGTLTMKGASGAEEGTIDAERLRTQEAEVGSDVTSSIDRHPAMQKVGAKAGELQTNMENMQLLLQTAMDSKANVSDAYVDQLHDYARPMQEILENPETKNDVMAAQKLLKNQLLRCQMGEYLGRGVEQDIKDRIEALDDYIQVLSDQKLLHAVHTAMEVTPDTWAYWMTTDGLIMLAAIVAAVIAVVAVTAIIGIATGGVGLAFVPTLLITSGVGAAAGIGGAELAKEGIYQVRNTWGGAATGQYRYTNGSRLGNWARGQQKFDAVKGEYVDMSFLEDVASPYAQEFLFNFAVTAASLGLGHVAGEALSSLAQSSKFLAGLAKNYPLANSIMTYMSGMTDDVARIPANAREFAQKVFMEILDELKDEFVIEAGVEQGLMRIDARLAFLATFIVTAARGFKPLKGGSFSYPGSMSSADVAAFMTEQGHTVVSNVNGVLDVKTFDGQTLILRPETVVEGAQGVANDASEQVPPVDAKAEPKAADVTALTENGEQSLLGARNRTGASPETTQEAALALVTNRLELAKAVNDPATRAEAIARYNALMVAQGGKALSEADVVKNCQKFEQVVAAIQAGNIGLDGKYVGSAIRDMNKLMPGIDMEGKQSLDRMLHEAAMKNENDKRIAKGEKPLANMNEYMEWLLSPDQTMEGGRPLTPNGEFAAEDVVHLGTNPETSTRLNGVVDAMSALAANPDSTFDLAQVEAIVNANPALDSIDREILLQTATLLANIEAKAGEASLPAAERWKILEFSARYAQDFRASPEFKATPQQLLNLIADNAVNLAHQNIMDHMTLVGSSHGTLHVLRGNSEMLNSLYGQMGFTPAMRVLAMQATFDHDMGYTKRTLVGKKPGDGVFDSSKDHPLESTLRVESKRAEYEAIFGRDGYVTIRNAVLDHSDAMGTNDRQYADYATKLDIIADKNAPPADRVAAAVALVDCLATVSNLKASPLFKHNPEVMATMARVEQIHREINAKVAEHKAALKAEGKPDAEVDASGKAFEKASPEIAALREQAKSMRLAMQARIAQMTEIPEATRTAYLTSLDSTMQWEGSDFAITSNLGMLAASVSPELRIDAEGKIHATYTVDTGGLATISQALDPKTARKAATSGIIKAADDFGKFTAESETQLAEFVEHAGNMESADPAKRAAAEAYFAQNNGQLSLPTKSRLVVEVKLGSNPEYVATRRAVEAGLRIDAIRGLARANIDKLMAGEPITIPGVDGSQVELADPAALQTYAESAVAEYVASLPADYVMQDSSGRYVPVQQAFDEAAAAARNAPVTWKEFGDRMFRTAGSKAPLQRTAA